MKQEVECLTKLLREKDEELQQLYLETRQSTAATGEYQLFETEGNAYFSMWRKIKLVGGGVWMGLVTLLLAMVEVENLPFVLETLLILEDMFVLEAPHVL